jgi:hypothetical protein
MSDDPDIYAIRRRAFALRNNLPMLLAFRRIQCGAGSNAAKVPVLTYTRSIRRLKNGIGAGMARTSLLVLPRSGL